MKYVVIILIVTSSFSLFGQAKDSIGVADTFENNYMIIPKEIGTGLLFGIISAIPTGYIGYFLGGKSGNYATGLYGMYAGYTIGTALGVYFIAHNLNPNLSFVNTLSSSIIGSAIGYGLFKISNQKGIGSAMALVMPLLFPILYANILEPPILKQHNISFSPIINIHKNKLLYHMQITIYL